MTENQMIDELIKGEEQAFVQLMQLYGNKLLGTCYLILKDREEAEDVVQETFVRVFKNIKSFKRSSNLYTWIYRIAINISRDKLRKRSYDLSLNEEIIGDENIESLVEHKLELVELKSRLAALNPIYREVLVLFYYQELSIAEISNLLNEKEGTIKSRLSRARNILAQEIQRGGTEDEKE
ncbi:MAG: RNA polymerase sigma factor [Bacillota bacterium]